MENIEEKITKFDEKCIEAILDERRQLRQELIVLQRTIMGLVPLLVTVLGGFFIASLSKDVPLFFQANRGVVLAFLNQLLFFLGLYTVLILINGQIHNRYIAHLEHKLNNLFGKPICIWEISGDAFQPTFTVLSGALFVTVSAGFLALAYLTFTETHIYWLFLLNICQLLVVAGMLTYQFIWGDKHYDRYLDKLDKNRDKKSAI
jgi:hypothetical protein